MTRAKRTRTEEHGVRWIEICLAGRQVGRHGRLTRKQRIFKTEAALDRFIEKLPERRGFYAFDAFLG